MLGEYTGDARETYAVPIVDGVVKAFNSCQEFVKIINQFYQEHLGSVGLSVLPDVRFFREMFGDEVSDGLMTTPFYDAALDIRNDISQFNRAIRASVEEYRDFCINLSNLVDILREKHKLEYKSFDDDVEKLPFKSDVSRVVDAALSRNKGYEYVYQYDLAKKLFSLLKKVDKAYAREGAWMSLDAFKIVWSMKGVYNSSTKKARLDKKILKLEEYLISSLKLQAEIKGLLGRRDKRLLTPEAVKFALEVEKLRKVGGKRKSIADCAKLFPRDISSETQDAVRKLREAINVAKHRGASKPHVSKKRRSRRR